MRALDAIASRLGAEGRAAVALLGGVVATWTLFGVGAAVWYGVLPPGSFLVALLLVFLAVAVLAPIPETGPEPEPHPVWQRELEEREGDDEWDVDVGDWPPDDED